MSKLIIALTTTFRWPNVNCLRTPSTSVQCRETQGFRLGRPVSDWTTKPLWGFCQYKRHWATLDTHRFNHWLATQDLKRAVDSRANNGFKGTHWPATAEARRVTSRTATTVKESPYCPCPEKCSAWSSYNICAKLLTCGSVKNKPDSVEQIFVLKTIIEQSWRSALADVN